MSTQMAHQQPPQEGRHAHAHARHAHASSGRVMLFNVPVKESPRLSTG